MAREQMEPPAEAGGEWWLTAFVFGYLLLPALAAAVGYRLDHVDRIGGGKGFLQSLFKLPFEPTLLGLLPVALGLVVEFMLRDGIVRDCHRCLLEAILVVAHGDNAQGMSGVPLFPLPNAA